MIIQHNMMALNSYNRLSGNNTLVSKNLEKLSSGFKINRAGDDAAGLAISEKMRAQITGLTRATQNSQDGISLVQTAEGQLTEVHSMLNRMVDLATQSSNGTIDNDVDRKNLQKEVQSLKDEINRIAETSHFNGIKLLDGSMGSGKASYSAAFAANTAQGTGANTFENLDANVKSIKITSAQGAADAQSASFNETTGELTISLTRDIAGTATAVTNAQVQAELDKLDMGIKLGTQSGDFAAAGAIKVATSTVEKAQFTKIPAATAEVSDTTTAGVKVDIKALISGADYNKSVIFASSASGEVGATVNENTGAVTINLLDGENYTSEDINKMLKNAGADYTVDFKGKTTGVDLETLATQTLAGGAGLAGGGLSLQIGDTADQRVEVKVGSMSVTSLGLDAVDVSLENLATDSIDVIKTAINTVSSTRADLGAIQNRLEHTINNLTTTTENMTAAEARIRDTDMAKEMMAFTKNNVLAQAAQAMLAQANQQPQQVLQLLR